MAKKGGDRGGRRPLKTEGDPRQPFSCRLRQSNLNWLTQERERTGKSAGEIVDHLIETHRPEDQLPDKSLEEENLNG